MLKYIVWFELVPFKSKLKVGLNISDPKCFLGTKYKDSNDFVNPVTTLAFIKYSKLS